MEEGLKPYIMSEKQIQDELNKKKYHKLRKGGKLHKYMEKKAKKNSQRQRRADAGPDFRVRQ